MSDYPVTIESIRASHGEKPELMPDAEFDAMLLEDAEASRHVPSNEALNAVGELAEEAVAIMRRLQKYEEVAKSLKERLRFLTEKALVDAMTEAKTSGFRTTDGVKISLDSVTRGGIPKDTEARAAALAWLRDNGHGDLVKTNVEAAFGRGAEALARDLAEYAKSKTSDVTLEMGVHPQTLAKWAREMTTAGTAFPAELLGIYRAQVAKITGL